MPPIHMLELAANGSQPARRIRLRDAPPATLLCAACNQLFVDAVILPGTGHTFCRSCVNDSSATVVPNLAVRAQASAVVVHCPNGKSNGIGCQETTTLAALEDHIAKFCLHVKTVCPNAATCGRMTRIALANHLVSCKHFSCQFHVFGCDFADNRESTPVPGLQDLHWPG